MQEKGDLAKGHEGRKKMSNTLLLILGKGARNAASYDSPGEPRRVERSVGIRWAAALGLGGPPAVVGPLVMAVAQPLGIVGRVAALDSAAATLAVGRYVRWSLYWVHSLDESICPCGGSHHGPDQIVPRNAQRRAYLDFGVCGSDGVKGGVEPAYCDKGLLSRSGLSRSHFVVLPDL